MYNHQRTQSIKEGAYFDYFKYFSSTAASTIRKLQTSFQSQITEDLFFDSTHLLKRIKTLLGAYEVLILQINDSCEFVEMPQFGVCILKIFFQLMSVIKFLAKGLALKGPLEKTEKQKRADHRHTMVIPNTDSFNETTENRQKQKFRVKEMATHIYKELTQQMKILQIEEKANTKQNDDTINRIKQGRSRLEEIQSSQSQAVLAETVTLLFKRGQHINNFLNVLQSGQNQVKQSLTQTYGKLKQSIDEQNNQKIALAKSKLNKIFSEHMISYENKKKQSMQSREIQVKLQVYDISQNEKARKSQYKKVHAQQIKKLKQEQRYLQQENKALKAYIQEKNQQLQNTATKLRAEKISLQNKLANTESNYSSIQKSKWSIDNSNNIPANKKSFSNFDNYEYVDNMSEIQSHLSFDEEPPRQFMDLAQKNLIKRSRVALPKGGKQKVKFQNQCSQQLQLQSQVVEFCFQKIQEEQVPTHQPALLDPHSSKILEAYSFSNMQKIQEQPGEGEQDSYDFNKKDIDHIKMGDDKENKDQNKIIRPCSGRGLSHDKDSLLSSSQGELIKIKKPELIHVTSKQLLWDSKQGFFDKSNKKTKYSKKQSILQMLQGAEQKKKSRQKFVTTQSVNNLQSGNLNSFKSMKEKDNQLKKLSRFKTNKPLEVNAILSKDQITNTTPKLVNNNKIINKVKVKWILNFQTEDVNQLFLSEQNAKNYQILNLTLSIKQKKYFSNIAPQNIKRQLKDVSFKQNQQGKGNTQIQPVSEQSINYISTIIFKVLTILKRDPKIYKKLKNFLRYPHSYMILGNSKEWEEYDQPQLQIDYFQLRKMITRIKKLHYNCQESVCQHWKYFLKKLSLDHQLNKTVAPADISINPQ